MKKQTKLFTTLSAAALLTIGVSAVSMAAGWDNSTGEWRYLNNDGTEVTDTWKSANGNWFYLNSDGVMATNQLIEDNNNSKTRYYYVDQYGAMVKNTWKAVAMENNNGDLDAEYWWYYFGSDGKAYTSEAPLTSSKIKVIDGKKYAFNEEGHMLYGWISETSLDQQDNDEDAWKTSTYYCNGWNDGHVQTGWIQLTVHDSDNTDDETQTYWFHFKNDGKKRVKAAKINGKRYYFTEDGHMLTNWAMGTTSTSYSIKDGAAQSLGTSSVVYVNGDGSERKNKWVWAVPDEHYCDAVPSSVYQSVKDDYDDDEYRWWYFNNSGKLTANQIKKINGKSYAFDAAGRMQKGFVYDDGAIVKLKNPGDLVKADFLANGSGYNTTMESLTVTDGMKKLYYFSNDEEKDGAMKKGYQNIELDDGTAQFYFNTSNGKAYSSYVSKIKKYVKNGLVLEPTSDDDSNYAGVVCSDSEYKVPTDLVFGRDTIGTILVNKSGTKVTSKTKLKDDNDAYYIVNKAGKVLAYYGSEAEYDEATSKTENDKTRRVNVTNLLKQYTELSADPATFQSALQSEKNALFS